MHDVLRVCSILGRMGIVLPSFLVCGASMGFGLV
jgi:hypothetical protein